MFVAEHLCSFVSNVETDGVNLVRYAVWTFGQDDFRRDEPSKQC